jgi:hypothetical protein
LDLKPGSRAIPITPSEELPASICKGMEAKVDTVPVLESNLRTRPRRSVKYTSTMPLASWEGEASRSKAIFMGSLTMSLARVAMSANSNWASARSPHPCHFRAARAWGARQMAENTRK